MGPLDLAGASPGPGCRVAFYGKLCRMSDAAKKYELPAEVAQAVRRGERVIGTDDDGVTLAAIVPVEELRRLEALAGAQEQRAREKRIIDEARRRVLSSEANRHVLSELAKR
jgi:hypothetical protein